VVTYSCGQCGANLAFEGVRTQTCPYCASPNFVERPPSPGQPDPAFVVTFTGDAEVARNRLDAWLGSRTLFADSALKRATVEDIRGIYLPAYLYSAVARTDYTAQIGEQYTETETYTTTENGKTVTKTRTVTRTEYRPLAGRHLGYITDVVVSASSGLANAELQSVEPFDLRQLRRFSPALVSGWIHEEFSRTSDECHRMSRTEAVDEVGIRLRRFMPGDSHSDLAWRTAVEWESLDPVLVPVWVLALRYRGDKAPLRVVINGQTGKVAGKVPLSWWKVTLGIVLALAVIAAVIFLFAGHKP
jgi:DNA-directed RNA polymerase subunit RPC12/RpoP